MSYKYGKNYYYCHIYMSRFSFEANIRKNLRFDIILNFLGNLENLA